LSVKSGRVTGRPDDAGAWITGARSRRVVTIRQLMTTGRGSDVSPSLENDSDDPARPQRARDPL